MKNKIEENKQKPPMLRDDITDFSTFWNKSNCDTSILRKRPIKDRFFSFSKGLDIETKTKKKKKSTKKVCWKKKNVFFVVLFNKSSVIHFSFFNCCEKKLLKNLPFFISPSKCQDFFGSKDSEVLMRYLS